MGHLKKINRREMKKKLLPFRNKETKSASLYNNLLNRSSLFHKFTRYPKRCSLSGCACSPAIPLQFRNLTNLNLTWHLELGAGLALWVYFFLMQLLFIYSENYRNGSEYFESRM